jgi:hypothetical protein
MVGLRQTCSVVFVIVAVFVTLSTAQTSQNPSTITVVVHPLHAPVTSMVTQQFTATVTGTDNTAVTWYIDGRKGGSKTVGFISTGGLYTPPANFVVGGHTVKAVSQANNTTYGDADLYLTAYPGLYSIKNDNSRDGQDLQETILTPENVTVSKFGKIFTFPTDGISFAQPLYVANVNIPTPLNGSAGYHNVLYVVTNNDSLYAFDADGKVTEPLWYDSFIDPPGIIPVPGSCVNWNGKEGITPTPVIDPTTNTIYVEVRTLENTTGGCTGNYVQRLHALDITTGEEKFGGPVVVQAQVSGTGIGSENGIVSFSPQWENVRPGLLLSQSSYDQNSVVYLGAASLNDTEPYHGWLLGYDSQTLALKYVYCTTANGSAGGFWQMGSGLAADSDGNIFLQTGNGTFDNLTDFGMTVMKLAPNGTSVELVDSYTPDNYVLLNQQDWDLSSSGLLLLPDQPGTYPHLMIGGGKEGTIYVIDRDDLGGYNPNGNNIVQYIVGAIKGSQPGKQPYAGMWNSASYFNGNVYIIAQGDYPKMFTLNNGMMPTTATSQATFTMWGETTIISANAANNGIAWVLQFEAPALWAFNPSNLAHIYYDTTQDPTRDSLGSGPVTRTNPTVANGRVYVPGNTKILVYGLLE